MKRKSFKKALAGISAAAMLVSAMPMTLIADAYSSISMVDIDKVTLTSWATDLTTANGLSTKYMYKKDKQFSAQALTDMDLADFNVKNVAAYQYDEVYATVPSSGVQEPTAVIEAKFNFAQAEADFIAELKDKGCDRVTAVEFYDNETTDGANFGLIKSVTMDMPVTTGNGGVEEWSHEEIKFTVVRNAADFTKIATGQKSEARHFILAADVTTVETAQVAFTAGIDINLNGFTLHTKKGLQVNGAKMRIWNGKANTTKTVDKIITQLYSDTNPLTGWNILKDNGATLTDVRFVVGDSIACRLDAAATNNPSTVADKQKGFLVASGFATGKFTRTQASNWAAGMKTGYNVDGAVDKSSIQEVQEGTTAKYSFYVSADQDIYVSGGGNNAAHKNATDVKNGAVAYPTASFTEGSNHYTVIFAGGVKHIEFTGDKNADGTYISEKSTANPTKNVVGVNNKVSGKFDSTHSYVGVNCDCILATEECTNDVKAINGLKHEVVCSKCESTSDNAAVPHEFEVLFTIGNVTVKRCMGCGYVTAVKETTILASTPTIKLQNGEDNGVAKTFFRQTYEFQITAGDGEILSYGVIAKKNPTATESIDIHKVALGAGNYFTSDGLLDETALEASNLSSSSRKGIKTNDTEEKQLRHFFFIIIFFCFDSYIIYTFS